MPFTTNPFTVRSVEDVLKAQYVFRKAIERETALNEYEKGCEEACGDCDQCLRVKNKVAALLTHPWTYVWEVHTTDPVDFVGILVLSRVDPGRDATAIFTFFDGKLRDKTEVLRSWFDWSFENFALNRITVEIPAYAFAAIRHAKKLGFGGDFVYQNFKIEGIKRQALMKEETPVDLVIMGRTNAT